MPLRMITHPVRNNYRSLISKHYRLIPLGSSFSCEFSKRRVLEFRSPQLFNVYSCSACCRQEGLSIDWICSLRSNFKMQFQFMVLQLTASPSIQAEIQSFVFIFYRLWFSHSQSFYYFIKTCIICIPHFLHNSRWLIHSYLKVENIVNTHILVWDCYTDTTQI